jgi:hypothetical protein
MKFLKAAFLATTALLVPALAEARTQLTSNLTLYVDNVLGSDSNNCAGPGTNACATPQHVMHVIAVEYDYGGYNITIQLTAEQTYTASGVPYVLGLLNGVGQGELIIDGATTATISATGCGSIPQDAIDTQANVTQFVNIQNVKLSSSCGFGVLNQDMAAIAVGSGVTFLNGGLGHIGAQDAGATIVLTGPYTISGSADTHLNAAINGEIWNNGAAVTLTGTPAFGVFASIGANSTYWEGPKGTFTGSATGKRYNAWMNGVIYTGGQGANHFPGSTAGESPTGGQYY